MKAEKKEKNSFGAQGKLSTSPIERERRDKVQKRGKGIRGERGYVSGGKTIIEGHTLQTRGKSLSPSKKKRRGKNLIGFLSIRGLLKGEETLPQKEGTNATS